MLPAAPNKMLFRISIVLLNYQNYWFVIAVLTAATALAISDLSETQIDDVLLSASTCQINNLFNATSGVWAVVAVQKAFCM